MLATGIPFPALFLLICAGVAMATGAEVAASDTAVDNLCQGDDDAANVCLGCSSLPFQTDISFESCCLDKESFIFCDACLTDEESCKIVIAETEDVKTMYDDYSSDVDDDVTSDVAYDSLEDYNENDMSDLFQENQNGVDVQKRFGRLYVTSPKRFGRLLFGKRSGQEPEIDKRYGRLFTGYRPLFGRRNTGKRFGRLFTGSRSRFGKRSDFDDSAIEKRYGRVFMGGKPRLRYYGKRSEDSEEVSETDKRFGRLFTFRKRDINDLEDSLSSEIGATPAEKRYGSLFVSSPFGKRIYGDDVDERDRDKRYGRLYMNSSNRWRSPGNRFLLGKRFGRLFTGGRKYYFG